MDEEKFNVAQKHQQTAFFSAIVQPIAQTKSTGSHI
jgi:hypothetical protein